MGKARKYVVKSHFKGEPKRSDFEIVEFELPPLNDGDFIVKTEWISVDPSHRVSNHLMDVPYDQFGYTVGTVVESKDPEFPVGTAVVSFSGWCDYTVLNTKRERRYQYYADAIYKLPEVKGFPRSLGVGAIGMPGLTAYFGLLDVLKAKSGETVAVSGAAGAVGSVVGQIAKIKGCKVIGFAGSDDKVKWLENELGFDKAINYKTDNIIKSLKEFAPEGIDCYFDNVGGQISSEVMSHMRMYGRVAICGSVSAYNDDLFGYSSSSAKATIIQPFVLIHQLTVKAFGYMYYEDRWPEAFKDLAKWIESGKLIAKDHVTEGFDKVFDSFVGMMKGENFGKAVVKV